MSFFSVILSVFFPVIQRHSFVILRLSRRITTKSICFLFLLSFLSQIIYADEKFDFTLLQTGDLHSHFLPVQEGPFQLGGYARLKTIMDRIRAQEKNVFYFDSGDFSEGSIFFQVDKARASLEMLDRLGADAVVLGNHDWYRGPYFLENLLKKSKIKFPVLSSNLFYEELTSSLNNYIKTYDAYVESGKTSDAPWKIIECDGVKIGVFGLSTSEFFYEYMFFPVEVKNPISIAKSIVAQLRPKVDVLVALTHMPDELDEILEKEVPEIDVILGGHSHHLFPKARLFEIEDMKALIEEIEVIDEMLKNPELPEEEKAPLREQLVGLKKQVQYPKTWLLKTGEYGMHLGRLDFSFDRNTRTLSLKDSKTIPVFSEIEESPDLKELVGGYKRALIDKHGPIFDDVVALTEIDLPKITQCESPLGNLISDIVYEKAKAVDPAIEFAVTVSDFLSQGFNKGPIHSVEVYDAMSLIYNHETNDNWHLYKISMNGEDLKKILKVLLKAKRVVNFSNAEIVYSADQNPIETVLIAGQLLDPKKTYAFVAEKGVVDALGILQRVYFDGEGDRINYVIDDLGLTYWKVLREGLIKKSPITKEKASVQGRVRSQTPDLAVYAHEISSILEKKTLTDANLDILVKIRNLGEQDSPTAQLKVHFYKGYAHLNSLESRDDLLQIIKGNYEVSQIIDVIGARSEKEIHVRIPISIIAMATGARIYNWNTIIVTIESEGFLENFSNNAARVFLKH